MTDRDPTNGTDPVESIVEGTLERGDLVDVENVLEGPAEALENVTPEPEREKRRQ